MNGAKYLYDLDEFSSPFIEERLYFNTWCNPVSEDYNAFSSPFIEERLYLG